MSFKVVGIGEVLWDLLPSGPQLGGAPTNFAWHASALGAVSRLITRVGNDPLGRRVLADFERMHFPLSTVQVDSDHPTGTAAVALSNTGVPEFRIAADAAWDFLQVTESALQAVRDADAICFGSLAQRHPTARAAIQQLVAAARPGALRIFDINLRQRDYSRELIERSSRLADVLKLNEVELAIMQDMFALSGDPAAQLEQLARAFGLATVALTRGPAGSLIYHEGEWSERRPPPVTVVDTVGAGDAFTAALTMGLLRRLDLSALHVAAEELASFVCSRVGAMPPLTEILRRQRASD
jgi:fructokinase